MTLVMTDYQKSIDNYVNSGTRFENLSPDDVISLVIEYLDETGDGLFIKIPAHELSAFFKKLLKHDDSNSDSINSFKRCFLHDAAKYIKDIQTDLKVLGKAAND